MKRLRSATCLLLVILLAFSSLLFTGCGTKKKEVITLDVYSQLANYSGLQTGWFAQVLLD